MDRLGDRIGNVVQLQVKKDRQIELRHLHHAVMAVGAEEFETELQAADMIFDGVCKVLRFFKVRGIDGDINRAAHTTPGEEVVEIEERSEEHTSELQSLMHSSYAGFSLKKNNS